MAGRTSLPLSTLVPNGADLNDAGTAVDQANGMIIALPTTGIPAPGSLERLLIWVESSYAGGTMTVTVKAGVGGGATPGAAFESGKGDLTTGNITASTGTAMIGPLEVARFLQLDGSVWLNFSTSATGTIWAFLVPRAF